jgi:hypothetical protein
MHAHIDVLQFPPKLSVSSLVNLLSLNGTWDNDFSDASADMQLLNAAIDLFMFLASYNLIPSDPVLLSLSLPAKSTIVSNAFLKCLFFTWFGDYYLESDAPGDDYFSTHLYSTRTCNTAWDLDEFLFIPVELADLLFTPFFII